MRAAFVFRAARGANFPHSVMAPKVQQSTKATILRRCECGIVSLVWSLVLILCILHIFRRDVGQHGRDSEISRLSRNDSLVLVGDVSHCYSVFFVSGRSVGMLSHSRERCELFA